MTYPGAPGSFRAVLRERANLCTRPLVSGSESWLTVTAAGGGSAKSLKTLVS